MAMKKEPWMDCATRRSLLSLVARMAIYAVLLAGIAAGMLWGAVKYGPAFYDEVGPVETLETLFAFGTAVVMLWAGRCDSRCAPCAVMVSGFLFCLVVRESDYFLDVLIARHAWKAIVLGLVGGFGAYFVRHAKRVLESVSDFMKQPSFGLWMSGLLVLVVFSRLFGYGGFWRQLVAVDHYREIKTIVEEGVELMGYFLLLIASLEYWYVAWGRSDRRGRSSARG